jgi:hypothetical protein
MHKMRDHGQHDRKDADRQDCVGGEGRNSARANHGGDDGNANDQRQMQQAAPAMAVEMVVVAAMAMAVPMTAPAPTTLFGLAFFERKFVAHTDIKFTHVIPYVSHGPIGRNESIIMESSNIK